MVPADPFGRPSAAPLDVTREGRVYLLAEAARALLAGRRPPPAAALFLGGAIGAWLAQGGDLDKDFLRVRAPRGSHRRPDRIAAASSPMKANAANPEEASADRNNSPLGSE